MMMSFEPPPTTVSVVVVVRAIASFFWHCKEKRMIMVAQANIACLETLKLAEHL